jgi:hypothetical protein
MTGDQCYPLLEEGDTDVLNQVFLHGRCSPRDV